ncbi:MAG: hypothetical protein N3E51_05100 [Candidatus Micrarchaeota archaeon]|nr:hypothetical protein [Candidatus Micrarchaeota archaeon]
MRVEILAMLIATMLLFGCANISGSAQAGSFGKKASEQKAYEYFKQKYGSPEGSGAPRIIEPFMTTYIDADFMPADKVLKYNKDAPSFYVWFFYDNFGQNDAIKVTFRYLEDGTEIYSFNSKGGGDYGAANFRLDKPQDGWPLGKYEVVISGKGVTERVQFEVIEGQTVKVPLPYEEAGLSAPKQEEQKPSASQPPTTAGMTSDEMVFDTTKGYLGACDLTDTSEFKLDTAIDASLVQVWYNWAEGESTITYSLKKDGQPFLDGVFVRADCDPYQKNWCNGNHKVSKTFSPGSYKLVISTKKMCLQPGKTGTFRIYGKIASSQPSGGSGGSASSAQLPSGIPEHLKGCDYSGTWETDWGTMVLKMDGNRVGGTYTHDSGRIEGEIVDGVFVGTWSEAPSYSPTRDAGDAVFYFTKDCNSFTGNWHYGKHQAGSTWSGSWWGKKKKS